MEKVTVRKRRKREELHLPTLSFMAADDWMDKLGTEAFGTWLKMYTYADRRDSNRTHDIIPKSLVKLAEQLKMSKSTFYKVIKPLWNYGLIDIIEYEKSSSLGQKPKNIIVYPYPFNNPKTRTQPLIKARDYDTEYTSICKEFGKRGGQPKHKVKTKRHPMNMKASSCSSVMEVAISSSYSAVNDTMISPMVDELGSPSIKTEPDITEPATPTPGTESEHPPVSDLYPIINTNTNIINKKDINTCVYKGVEKDSNNKVGEFEKIEKEWFDCFKTPLSYQAYCDLARVQEPGFICKTIRDIKIHEGDEGITKIHSPFKFVKSLLQREGYVVSKKCRKRRVCIPRSNFIYSKPTNDVEFTFYNWLNPISSC